MCYKNIFYNTYLITAAEIGKDVEESIILIIHNLLLTIKLIFLTMLLITCL